MSEPENPPGRTGEPHDPSDSTRRLPTTGQGESGEPDTGRSGGGSTYEAAPAAGRTGGRAGRVWGERRVAARQRALLVLPGARRPL
ncbi:hypothetical protein ABZ371_31800 [Streptomyces sp. NPDC005899]|uniref:hypothetical protein n=1 Tax=Streptomyces sp. NPDC005899 TaxID=3155716 RepID=UPI0033E8BFAE